MRGGESIGNECKVLGRQKEYIFKLLDSKVTIVNNNVTYIPNAKRIDFKHLYYKNIC